jgi:ribosomal protein S18 acetylase RimI-like enzyme
MNNFGGYRKLGLADLSEIKRVFRTIVAMTANKAFLGVTSAMDGASAMDGTSAMDGADWLESEIKSSEVRGVFHLDLEKNVLASFVIYRVLPGKVFDIVFLGTDPAFQRQGLMRTLFSHWLKEIGAGSEIWLEVHGGNQMAQNLYNQLGFRIVGQRVSYYKDGATALLATLET